MSLAEIFHRVLEFREMIRHAILTSSTQMLVTALIIIFLTGLVGGIIAKRLKQPLILGYILAGVFVGIAYKAGFGVEANDALDSLANIGVALLLFSMGLEFSKADIRPVFKIAVWGSLAQVFFTLLAGTGIAWMLSKYNAELIHGISSYLLFGTAFVSTSTAVILKTLASKNRMGTLSSRVMIGISIVQDLTVMPLMLVICKLDNLAAGAGQAVRPLVLGAVFMILMMTAGAKYIPMWLRHVARFESKELFLLAITGLALGIGMISEWMQVSFSFGAFLTGIVLSDSDYGKKALYEMMPVRDLFAMLFFVSIGMMLDCGFLVRNFPLVLVLMLLTGLARTLFLSCVTGFSGYRNVIPIAMFFGMFPTSEMAFVVIQTGRTAGIFTEGLYSLVLCVVVCSMIVGPAFDSLTSPVYSLLRKTVWKQAPATDIVLPPPDLSGHVIIAGGGQIARSIAHLLTRLQLPYMIVETEHPAFQAAKKDNLACLFGDPRQEVILNGAGVENAKILLAASVDSTENLGVIRNARKLNPMLPIVARADTPEEVEMLHEYRVFEIVQPKFEAGLELTRQALLSLQIPTLEIQNYLDAVRFDHYKPLLEGSPEYSTLAKMRSFAGLVALNWIQLPKGSVFSGLSIAQSEIRSKYGVSVVGILHDGKFVSNPPPRTVFTEGDIVALIGTSKEQEIFAKALGTGVKPTPAAAHRAALESEEAVRSV